jgi:hypothetical protein
MCLTTVNRVVQMPVGAVYCVEKCLAGTDISDCCTQPTAVDRICYNEI